MGWVAMRYRARGSAHKSLHTQVLHFIKVLCQKIGDIKKITMIMDRDVLKSYLQSALAIPYFA